MGRSVEGSRFKLSAAFRKFSPTFEVSKAKVYARDLDEQKFHNHQNEWLSAHRLLLRAVWEGQKKKMLL